MIIQNKSKGLTRMLARSETPEIELRDVEESAVFKLKDVFNNEFAVILDFDDIVKIAKKIKKLRSLKR